MNIRRFVSRVFFALLLSIAGGWNVTSLAQTTDLVQMSAGSTAKIEAMLKAASTASGSTASRLAAASALLDGAVFARTAAADADLQPMRVNLDTMDNLELVEYSLAAARASMQPQAAVRDFCDELRKIRYRRGDNNGFAARLRYASDWIADNAYRSNVREITFDLPGTVYATRTLDYITRHRDLFPALTDSAAFERMQALEMGYRLHKFPYMKKESVGKKQVVELLSDGDIFFVVPRSSDFDWSDAGIARIIDSKVYLIHGDEHSGRIRLDKVPLSELLRLHAKELSGYRVLRAKD